jgi:hypothetical protein
MLNDKGDWYKGETTQVATRRLLSQHTQWSGPGCDVVWEGVFQERKGPTTLKPCASFAPMPQQTHFCPCSLDCQADGGTKRFAIFHTKLAMLQS